MDMPMQQLKYDHRYPLVSDLREKARRRIPGFAFEYLDGGCNEETNLRRNISDLQSVILAPQYLKAYEGPSLKTALFGQEYDAPFGVAPVGLQGLIWPDSARLLASAAHRHNLPFVLSTVSTASIEDIAELTQGRAWFQLYHPKEPRLRDALLTRAHEAGLSVLVVLADVPTFSYRPREIRNGLSLPPRPSFRNLWQVLRSPVWAYETLRFGRPGFATLAPYLPKKLSLKHLGQFMNNTFDGRLHHDRLAALRNQWKGKLVLKGVAHTADVEKAIALGLDGIIVSNHGGRQLDPGPSALASLQQIGPNAKGKITVMMDSGLRSGPDIARALACGAESVFLGRAFMYGVGALGPKGGHQVASILKIQLRQVLEQLGCSHPTLLKEHLG
jgi:L-lactate dehydrogenase (cytochrome)